MFMDDQTETLLRLHIADPATAEGGPLLSYDDLSALYRGADGSLPRTVAAALRTIIVVVGTIGLWRLLTT